MKSGENKQPVNVIRVEPVKQEEDVTFTHYVLVPIDEKGKETGAEFSISRKGFETSYKNRTAKPEGAALKAKFKVKKKK